MNLLETPHTFSPRTAHLINGFICRNLTISDHLELDKWVSASLTNQKIFESLTENLVAEPTEKLKAKLNSM